MGNCVCTSFVSQAIFKDYAVFSVNYDYNMKVTGASNYSYIYLVLRNTFLKHLKDTGLRVAKFYSHKPKAGRKIRIFFSS